MGYYINNVKGVQLPPIRKADWLKSLAGAKEVSHPISFQPDLVCVVENGPFDAAAFAYSEEEMNEFLRPDGRKKTWLIVPEAAKISGYDD
jgi:hypothetical protein